MRSSGLYTFVAAVTAFSTLGAGCATRADLERLRREQRETRARVADLQANMETVRRQVDTTGEDDSTARALAATESLEARVATLEDMIKNLATTQLSVPAAGVADGGPAAGLTNGVARTQAAKLAWEREAASVQSGSLDADYQRGLQLYREGQTEQAIRALREFVNKNPKSDLADNAQFWLGEAYYSRGDYNRAIIELNEVLLKYPQGDQIPGALLALATAFANSGDKIDARLILQKLVSDHPSSEEAAIGRDQLTALTN
jgi:tol-pal system protein YbgF